MLNLYKLVTLWKRKSFITQGRLSLIILASYLPTASSGHVKQSFWLTLRSGEAWTLNLYGLRTGMSSFVWVLSCSSVFVYMAQVQNFTSIRVVAVRVHSSCCTPSRFSFPVRKPILLSRTRRTTVLFSILFLFSPFCSKIKPIPPWKKQKTKTVYAKVM